MAKYHQTLSFLCSDHAPPKRLIIVLKQWH